MLCSCVLLWEVPDILVRRFLRILDWTFVGKILAPYEAAFAKVHRSNTTIFREYNATSQVAAGDFCAARGTPFEFTEYSIVFELESIPAVPW